MKCDTKTGNGISMRNNKLWQVQITKMTENDYKDDGKQSTKMKYQDKWKEI